MPSTCLVSESASGRFAPMLEVFAYRSAHPVHCLQCHSNPLCCEPRSRASLPCCRPAGPSQAQALCSSYFWSAVKDFTFANGVVSLQGWVPALTHVDPGCSRRGLPPVRSASQEGEGLNLCLTGGSDPRVIVSQRQWYTRGAFWTARVKLAQPDSSVWGENFTPFKGHHKRWTILLGRMRFGYLGTPTITFF